MTLREAIGPLFKATVNRFTVTMFLMLAGPLWLNGLCN